MKTKLVLGILLTSTILIEGFNIFLSNSLAGSSMEISNLKTEIAKLEGKNATLRIELLSLSSFENISSRAAVLGFEENEDAVVMINAPLKVALR